MFATNVCEYLSFGGAVLGAIIGGTLGGIKYNSIAEVNIRKFSEYALDPNNSNGKNVIFEKFGYSKSNAKQLVKIYKKQGTKNFLSKTYNFGKLDQYGQRITMAIKLNGTTVKSGWMMLDKGIRLITPFAGFL